MNPDITANNYHGPQPHHQHPLTGHVSLNLHKSSLELIGVWGKSAGGVNALWFQKIPNVPDQNKLDFIFQTSQNLKN